MKENLRHDLYQGDIVTLTDKDNEVNMWYSTKTKRFVLELNAKVMVSLKTFESFKKAANKILTRNGIQNID